MQLSQLLLLAVFDLLDQRGLVLCAPPGLENQFNPRFQKCLLLLWNLIPLNHPRIVNSDEFMSVTFEIELEGLRRAFDLEVLPRKIQEYF